MLERIIISWHQKKWLILVAIFSLFSSARKRPQNQSMYLAEASPLRISDSFVDEAEMFLRKSNRPSLNQTRQLQSEEPGQSTLLKNAGTEPLNGETPSISNKLSQVLNEQPKTEPAQASCNLLQDSCPFDWQFDKACDQAVTPKCQNADCFDCDSLLQYSYDCAACVTNGGYWCPGDAICQSQALGETYWAQYQGRKESACPTTDDWKQSCEVVGTDNVYTDPLYDAMAWMYRLINVESVWRQGITGKDVLVRINDVGVDATHPDLALNFDVNNSCSDYLPSSPDTDVHGTATASILAAGANNGACSVGIAPEAILTACLLGDQEDQVIQMFLTKWEQVQISSNSWGPAVCSSPYITGQQRGRFLQQCPFLPNNFDSPCQICGDFATHQLSTECQDAVSRYCLDHYEDDPVACADYLDLFVDSCKYNSLSPKVQAALSQTIVEGRNGKGLIYVFAAGNDYFLGVDINSEGYLNSRFTIGVAAVGHNGVHASYSTTGAAVFVAAPGGDKESISNNVVANPGGGCHDITYGTSFAAPVVSGVIALMLQVNPELGWRDIQGILAASAQQVEPNDTSWTTNGAGFRHSYKYGFGLVDAASAVELSKSWINWDAEQRIILDSGPVNLPIADSSQDIVQSNITVNQAGVRVEAVAIYVDLSYFSRGDLNITLVSPLGTESELARPKRPENQQLPSGERWKLMTLRNWNESPFGVWKLYIVDESPGSASNCADYPWEFPVVSPKTGKLGNITCSDFIEGQCPNGNDTASSLSYGRTIYEACCACGGGASQSDVPSLLRSWKLAIYGHNETEQDSLITQAPGTTPGSSTSTLGSNTTSPGLNATVHSADLLMLECGTFADEGCPFSLLFDGVCDNNIEQCSTADCVDCDVCYQDYSYDCQSCISNGCVWCPGDGVCMSGALGGSYWVQFDGRKVSTCPEASDWVDVCDVGPGTNVYPDPLYSAMSWAYQLINVESVWREGITGKGVHVRVNDDGVDANHPDFISKFDIENSCPSYLPVNPSNDTQGTACAAIIGASANDACSVGIAPNATISACVMPMNGDEQEEAQMFVNKLDAVDISSNSWGPTMCVSKYLKRRRNLQTCIFSPDNFDSPCETCKNYPTENRTECERAMSFYCLQHYEDDPIACTEYLDLFATRCQYRLLPPNLQSVFLKTITEGRGGKGVIYVFAAGDGYALGVDINANGYLNSRFTIAVGAVGHDGLHASYSTTGAAVFLTAPGGDVESLSNNIVAKPGGGCHDVTIGTSFAAPMVSGVIALMLEANPNLGWRDVQGILAATSQQIDPGDDSWTKNGANFSHSYKYGFGLVDAAEAVRTAKTWAIWGIERHIMVDSGPLNATIADNAAATLSSTFSVNNTDGEQIVAESTVVYLDIHHRSRRDLKISLTSPQGTQSLLMPSGRSENQQLNATEHWKLMTLRNWGENPFGDWKLDITDESPGAFSDCFDLDWEYQSTIGSYSCIDFLDVTDCKNESQVVHDLASAVFQNRTIFDACCACGGGELASNVQDVFLSWKLMVYGHNYPPPTNSPTVVGNDGGNSTNGTSPTVGPRGSSTARSVLPTNAPTSRPVDGPLAHAIIDITPPSVVAPWVGTSGEESAFALCSLGLIMFLFLCSLALD